LPTSVHRLWTQHADRFEKSDRSRRYAPRRKLRKWKRHVAVTRSAAKLRRHAKVEQPRLSRQDWISGAVQKLSEDSVAALRVDELAAFLKVTKGSFYWHFQSREDLLEAVLTWWRTLMTSETTTIVSRLPDTGWERLRVLLHIGLSTRSYAPGGPFELTLRDWARRSTRVAQVVREVDEARISFAEELYRQAGLDPETARDYGEAHLAFVIGAHTAFPSASRAEIARQREIAEKLFLPRHLAEKDKNQ